MRFPRLGLLLAFVLAWVACDGNEGTVLSVDARADLLLVGAYLDRDGDGQPTTPTDPGFRGLRVAVQPAAGGPTVASATTDSLGFARFEDLPVGSYRLTTDRVALGDTVDVIQTDNSIFTLGANDSTIALIAIGYNAASIKQLVTLPVGRRLAISATALNSWPTFGDSSVHLADTTGAVRAIGTRTPTILAGDRVRVIVTVSEQNGRRVLTDLSLVTRTAGELPAPPDLTTAAAAQAGTAARYDADQVRVHNARVTDDGATLPGGDVRWTIDDQSGPLELIIDASAGIATALPITRGAELDVAGVLVPRSDGSGRWRLKPRRSIDIAVRYVPITVAAARARQVGQFVSVNAVALNNQNALGDGSVHITDASGAIRVINPSGLFTEGDSVNVSARVGNVLGQPVLQQASITVLKSGARVDTVSLSTTQAAAAGATNDARLAKLANATVEVAGGVVRLNDGSGPVDLVPPVGGDFVSPAHGSTVDLVGLLVPVANGRWVIRPRRAADLTVK